MNALLVRRKFIKVLVAKIENIMLRNLKMSFSRVSLPLARHIVGSRPDGVKPKTVKLVFGASPLSTQQEKEQRLVGPGSG